MSVQYLSSAYSSILRAKGPDAREFLQGQFSQDLAGLAAGGVAYGLLLDRRGKIEADGFVVCAGDEEFWVASYFCQESLLFERLNAYLVMEEVELERLGAPDRSLALIGHGAREWAVSALEWDAQEDSACPQMRAGLLLAAGRRGAIESVDVLALEEAGLARFGRLRKKATDAGLAESSPSELDRLAIEAVLPLIGRGFGSADLPQDLGIVGEAVSFSKGCYLGQEVMARLKAIGRTRRRLAVVMIERSRPAGVFELPQELLDAEGKVQGSLRSVSYSDSGAIGLAVVNVRHQGSRLTLASSNIGVELT